MQIGHTWSKEDDNLELGITFDALSKCISHECRTYISLDQKSKINMKI